MPHIVFNGGRHEVSEEQAQEIRDAIATHEPGVIVTFLIEDDDGDTSELFIPWGAPITLNSWSSPDLSMSDIGPQPVWRSPLE